MRCDFFLQISDNLIENKRMTNVDNHMFCHEKKKICMKKKILLILMAIRVFKKRQCYYYKYVYSLSEINNYYIVL